MLKLFIGIGLVVGSIAGGYLPVLWGGSVFSITSILTSTAGGLLGIFLGYQIGQNYE
jgi:hypothetical protein